MRPSVRGQAAFSSPAGRKVRVVARWAAAAVVLGACGYYLATRTDRQALAGALQRADYLIILAMTIGHLVVVLPIKAWRWQLMQPFLISKRSKSDGDLPR